MEITERVSGNRLTTALGLLTGCLLVAASSPSVHGQTGRIELSVGYPIPESNMTFSDGYNGQLHLGAAYSHPIARRYRLGAGADYSRFRGHPLLVIGMRVFTSSVHGTYLTRLSKDLGFEGTIRIGWAWMTYVLDEPAFVELDADESGPFVAPGVYLSYTVSKRFAVRSGVAYSVIFEHFQDDQAIEDSTIRYFAVTTGVALSL